MEHILILGDGHWGLLGNKYWPDTMLNNDLDTLALACLWCQPGRHVIYFDEFGMTTKENSVIPYDFLYGTSMATPFVAGAVGTLSNLNDNYTAIELKNELLSCTRKSTNLEGKVATGGVLDLSKATISTITHPSGITLDKSSAKIFVGENMQLVPTVTPEDATNKNIKWTSSNPNVAKIENGMVTAISEGTATITAITEDGNYEALCEIIVDKVKLEKILITTPPLKTTYKSGENFDKTGMVIKAYYNNGTSKEITEYIIKDGKNLKVGKKDITISYTEDNITKTVPQTITVKQKLTYSFNKYKTKNTKGSNYLYNINPNTTIEQMTKNIKTNGKITILKNSKKITNKKTIVSTGMKIVFLLDNENITYKISVKGDTSGDGKVNINDSLQISKHLIKRNVLKNEYLLAGDVNLDNKLNSIDLLRINKYRLGLIRNL